MKTDVIITMTLTEVKELRESTILGMLALKEKIPHLKVGPERSLAIDAYKTMEKFRDRITY